MNQSSSAEDIMTGQPRRRKTRLQVFKETYLPYLILLLAVVLCITFVVGSFQRAKQQKAIEKEQTKDPNSSGGNQVVMQMEEAEDLMRQAQVLASHYDYAGAMEVLNRFSGEKSAAVGMQEAYDSYAQKKAELVPWTEMDKIPNLSFQMLVADPSRAFTHSTYGTSFNKNYVTTTEFTQILQQLYDGGFVLVSVYDLASYTEGQGYAQGQILLPAGKKPLVLTQTGVNYFTYMVDGDGDGLPDKDGAGFASRMVVDGNGKPTCELVDADGNVSTGAYDLVPILDAFLEEHPDFSYHGAKATLAVMGYDGIFGYRIDGGTASEKGDEFYQQQVEGARNVVEALKADGYDLACYSYDTGNYAAMTAEEIQADLSAWTQEIAPVLGQVDVLVYCNGNDIGDTGEYAGDKFDALYNTGFRFFIGQDHSSQGWVQVDSSFVRQTRRLVTGARLAYDTQVFADLFDVTKVTLSTDRGTVPQ